LAGVLVGSGGYYAISVLGNGNTAITSTVTSTVTTTQQAPPSVSSVSSTAQSSASGESTSSAVQSTYALNGNDTLALQWTLDGAYVGPLSSPNAASSITLVVTNLGRNSITGLSYEVPSVLGPMAGDVPLGSRSSETLVDVFVGAITCDMSSLILCPQQSALEVNATFSDGKSFSIPQPVVINYVASSSLYTYNTQSAFCKGLLSSISASNINASY